MYVLRERGSYRYFKKDKNELMKIPIGTYGSVAWILNNPLCKITSTKNIDKKDNRTNYQSVNLQASNLTNSAYYCSITRLNLQARRYRESFKGMPFPQDKLKNELDLIPIIKVWDLNDLLRNPKRITTREFSLYRSRKLDIKQPDFSECNAQWDRYDLDKDFELIYKSKLYMPNPVCIVVSSMLSVKREKEFRNKYSIPCDIPIIRDTSELLGNASPLDRYSYEPKLIDLRLRYAIRKLCYK